MSPPSPLILPKSSHSRDQLLPLPLDPWKPPHSIPWIQKCSGTNSLTKQGHPSNVKQATERAFDFLQVAVADKEFLPTAAE